MTLFLFLSLLSLAQLKEENKKRKKYTFYILITYIYTIKGRNLCNLQSSVSNMSLITYAALLKKILMI